MKLHCLLGKSEWDSWKLLDSSRRELAKKMGGWAYRKCKRCGKNRSLQVRRMKRRIVSSSATARLALKMEDSVREVQLIRGARSEILEAGSGGLLAYRYLCG